MDRTTTKTGQDEPIIMYPHPAIPPMDKIRLADLTELQSLLFGDPHLELGADATGDTDISPALLRIPGCLVQKSLYPLQSNPGIISSLLLVPHMPEVRESRFKATGHPPRYL